MAEKGFEKYSHKIKDSTIIIKTDSFSLPAEFVSRTQSYNLDQLSQSSKSKNITLLGVLTKLLKFDKEKFAHLIESRFPSKFKEANFKKLYSLASQSDVVIENFRSGKVKELKIDYDSLKEFNKEIIYASILGFG